MEQAGICNLLCWGLKATGFVVETFIESTRELKKRKKMRYRVMDLYYGALETAFVNLEQRGAIIRAWY